jgi:hypothetical protein
VPISPPSDIVLGVASAADPLKSRAAAEQLMRAAGAKAAEAAAEAKKTGAVEPKEVQFTLPQAPRPADPSAKLRFIDDAQAARSAARTKAYKEFEAFLLQSFIESILPKSSAGFYGDGTAGEIWKSMLAEHVGREIANSSAFGIAERIAEHNARLEKARKSPPNGANSGAQAVPAAALTQPADAQSDAAAANNSSFLAKTPNTSLFGGRGS